MNTRCCLTVMFNLVAALSLLAQPPKAPPLPAIAPAQARLVETLGGKDGPWYALAAPESGETFFVAGENGTVVSWPRSAWMGVRVGATAPDIFKAHDGPITALASGGGWVATAGADRKVLLWALPGHELKHTISGSDFARALALSPDGKTLAIGDDSNSIRLVDTSSGKETSRLSAHSDWVLCLDFSPDGARLASGSYDGHAIIWDVAATKKVIEIPRRLPPFPGMPRVSTIVVTAIAFRNDGKMFAIGLANGSINLVNPADGKILRSVQPGHTSAATGLAFHGSGTVLASASKDRTVKLWNPENGQLLANLEGHAAWVQGVAFLEKGTRLVTASADQTVRIWDLTPKK